ncbi:sodium-dependent organic anion transporter-like [Watersipora subatra]|uniref:sodium-dependent organic anion transporter-like n=1 Tax=Watersipora subatra TaxID=2589382 RepID=UPI00355B973E
MKQLISVFLCLTQLVITCGQELLITPIRIEPFDKANLASETKDKSVNFILAEKEQAFLEFEFNCTANETTKTDLRLNFNSGSARNLHVSPFVDNVTCHENSTANGRSATISAHLLGIVKLSISDNQTAEHYLEYTIGVTRPSEGIPDRIYMYGIIILTGLATFTFGLSLDIGKVRDYLKKPIAPAIGVACQFLVMPLTGFIITLAISDVHPALQLGIFASATAPGGGLSNIFIYVLDGDLDLSITMTFISTCAALGFLPMWIYSLGVYIVKSTEIELPMADMAKTLALLIGPLAFGILLNKCLPRLTKILLYSQKAVVGLTMLFIIVYGTVVNSYAFRMVFTDLRLCLASFFLPYVGGLLGLCLALACKQGRKRAVTIGIETAVQNLNIAVIFLRASLDQPYGDMSSAIPLVIIICTFIPFPFMAAARLIYDKLRKKEKEDKIETEDDIEGISKEKKGIDNPVPVQEEKF